MSDLTDLPGVGSKTAQELRDAFDGTPDRTIDGQHYDIHVYESVGYAMRDPTHHDVDIEVEVAIRQWVADVDAVLPAAIYEGCIVEPLVDGDPLTTYNPNTATYWKARQDRAAALHDIEAHGVDHNQPPLSNCLFDGDTIHFVSYALWDWA